MNDAFMNDHNLQRLREISWQRPLTQTEAAELATLLGAHSQARLEWETEQQLNAALHRLPDTPVPSNFTALVLQRIESDTTTRKAAGRPVWEWSWRWMPKAAIAAVVLGAGLLLFEQQRAAERRLLSQSVAAFPAMNSMPAMEVLQDYDIIRRLGRAPAPDEELIALLQ